MKKDSEELPPTFVVMTRNQKGEEEFHDGPFSTGLGAQNAAKNAKPKFPGQKFFVVNEANDWRVRERKRIESGVYKVPKFAGNKVYQRMNPDHFAHISGKGNGFIAYTPNEEYGKKSKKLSRSVAKYIEEFYPKQSQAKALREHFEKEIDGIIRYSTEPQDAVMVYENGPSSCMLGNGWKKENHPAQIYEGGDMRLAYIPAKKEGRFAARAVVDTKRRIYSTPYGDYEGRQFDHWLQLAGYQRSCWQGGTFRLIVANPTEVAGKKLYRSMMFPIMDGAGYITIENGWGRIWGTRPAAPYLGIHGRGWIAIPENMYVPEGLDTVIYR